jgi:Predicted signal-transduction protein containing cAMP-binding and CBS domains
MQDVAEFLRGHPPFDAVERAQLTRLAAAAEAERYGPGAVILEQGTAPVEHVRVVRSGGVEIAHDGRVLDLLGPGELFGHAAMLSGLPTGFAAVAAEETLCYRIPAEVVRPLLGAPAGLRFVTRSLLALSTPGPVYAEPAVNPAQREVGELLRGTPVLCPRGCPSARPPSA